MEWVCDRACFWRWRRDWCVLVRVRGRGYVSVFANGGESGGWVCLCCMPVVGGCVSRCPRFIWQIRHDLQSLPGLPALKLGPWGTWCIDRPLWAAALSLLPPLFYGAVMPGARGLPLGPKIEAPYVLPLLGFTQALSSTRTPSITLTTPHTSTFTLLLESSPPNWAPGERLAPGSLRSLSVGYRGWTGICKRLCCLCLRGEGLDTFVWKLCLDLLTWKRGGACFQGDWGSTSGPGPNGLGALASRRQKGISSFSLWYVALFFCFFCAVWSPLSVLSPK